MRHTSEDAFFHASRKPTLEGQGLRLRPPRSVDAEWRHALGYHTEIVRMFGGVYATPRMRMEDANNWVERLSADPFGWIIEAAGQGIGEIRLHRVDLQDQTASLAVGILNPARLGQGLGRLAICLLAQHALGAMGLHRLSARVLSFNERAIRCYSACGFVTEGRERQSCRIGDERHDDIIMGLLAPEFRATSGSAN